MRRLLKILLWFVLAAITLSQWIGKASDVAQAPERVKELGKMWFFQSLADPLVAIGLTLTVLFAAYIVWSEGAVSSLQIWYAGTPKATNKAGDLPLYEAARQLYGRTATRDLGQMAEAIGETEDGIISYCLTFLYRNAPIKGRRRPSNEVSFVPSRNFTFSVNGSDIVAHGPRKEVYDCLSISASDLAEAIDLAEGLNWKSVGQEVDPALVRELNEAATTVVNEVTSPNIPPRKMGALWERISKLHDRLHGLSEMESLSGPLRDCAHDLCAALDEGDRRKKRECYEALMKAAVEARNATDWIKRNGNVTR